MARQTADILQVQTNPLDMTDGELRATFGDMRDSELMRALIMAEVWQIRDGAERERRTMRNFWYDHIKPVLSRAGRLGDKTSGGRDIDWPGKLSKYLVELVRAGETTYHELRIVDGSRQRSPAHDMTIRVASVRIVGGHYPWLILFTEKDTIWQEIESLASLYGTSAISGGGQPAAACTADVVRYILRSEAYDGRPLVLLSLTDYDPAGYSIADSQFAQLQEAAAIERREVRHERLGLTPAQLTQSERDAKAYIPKDAGLDAWYEQTGGVDGRRLGLELDALPISRLRAMFAEGIERHVDLSLRKADLREAFVELLAWEIVRPYMRERVANMIAQVKTNGLWERIQQSEIPAGLFARAAALGMNSINPLTVHGGEPLFDCADEIRKEIMWL